MRSDLVELDRISDYPAYWAGRHPEREAMVLDDIRWRYADLARNVDLYARALWAHGIRHGDRIAVLATPRPESLCLFLAAARIGAMFTGLNLRFQYDELRYVVEDCRPRLVIYLPAFRGRDYREDIRRLLNDDLGIEQAISFGNDHTRTDSPRTTLGVKGIGEAATIGSTPAIANAVMDALAPVGVIHVDIPLAPQKIWAAMHTAAKHTAAKR